MSVRGRILGHIRLTDHHLAIWRAQGKVCPVCGDSMVPASASHPTRGWTREHVWPRARYPYFADGNILISHARCNSEKADRDPTGCECLMLAAVNAQLGFELTELPRCYDDGVRGPSAIAVAFQQARAA